MYNTAFYQRKRSIKNSWHTVENIKNVIRILYHRLRAAYYEILHFYFLQSLQLNVENYHC
jgi:putative methionine-R-sulfoxide reductase with GAF domain